MAEHDPFLKSIEQYYLPRKLVDAIYVRGKIPTHSEESLVGVGFLDIADYTFLSKFLSPMENQILLNGLYTAFQAVLERHGGYLNKIEGDSLMFQFDSVIDPELGALEDEERRLRIARELFFTCVEMQRVCVLFNNANEGFLVRDVTDDGRQALSDAFAIIKTLRDRPDLSQSMSAFFQIRIRIGASLGNVNLGNFGPEGSKHWDIFGMPVIDAKRMEATSPVGGLRISEDFYNTLESLGIADDYFRRFQREAMVLGSRYAKITKDEIFAFKRVTVSEKRGASYNTYSVQVNPSFPETLGRQVESLLDQGPLGAERIIQFFQYFRGNTYVVDHLEALLRSKGVKLRKTDMLALLAPKKTAELQAAGTDIDAEYSLNKVFHVLGRHQDSLKGGREPAPPVGFLSYDQSMKATAAALEAEYQQLRTGLMQRTYFHEVVAPMLYHGLRASIFEYQNRAEGGEDLQEL